MSKQDKPRRFIRLDKLLEKVPFSKTTLRNKVRDGSFPKPYALGAQLRAWDEEEVEAWMAARPKDVKFEQGQKAAEAAKRKRKAA